jgi:hypothetical protein
MGVGGPIVFGLLAVEEEEEVEWEWEVRLVLALIRNFFIIATLQMATEMSELGIDDTVKLRGLNHV